MDFARMIRYAALACAALLLVGFDGGSCGASSGDGGAPPSVTNNLDPDPGCGAVCQIWCEHGNVLDADGCPTCACNPPPADGGTGGSDAPGCSPVACRLWCEHGFDRDANGCEICACAPPPDNACPDVLCDVWCEHGHVLDDAGCPTCACNQPPGDHCTGLGEKDCNATSGCLGVYEPHDSCACTPCPPDVQCFCDCPAGWGDFSHCVLDRPGPNACRTDADCPAGSWCGFDNLCVVDGRRACNDDGDCGPGGTCVDFASCMAIGCPPPGRFCDYPLCDGTERVAADGSGCVRPDGTRADRACCRAPAGR